jgi:hypothetical protein
MPFKPLIKISNLKEDAYLPNTYSFTANEASKIKKYLPKFLSFAGLDTENYSES